MSAFGPKRTSATAPHMSAFGGKADMTFCTAYVGFSNRPIGVKRFQAIPPLSVDVACRLALLFGIGTKALPVWDSRMRGTIF